MTIPFRKMRDKLALKMFKKRFKDLSKTEMEIVDKERYAFTPDNVDVPDSAEVCEKAKIIIDQLYRVVACVSSPFSTRRYLTLDFEKREFVEGADECTTKSFSLAVFEFENAECLLKNNGWEYFIVEFFLEQTTRIVLNDGHEDSEIEEDFVNCGITDVYLMEKEVTL